MDYRRSAVEHVLSVFPWRGWADMLDWLRAEGPGDPELSPDEYRALRQDAERADAAGAEFSNDPDRLWTQLRQHHR